jgi:hypothetical protein
MPIGKLAKARAAAARRVLRLIPVFKRSSTFLPRLVDSSSRLLQVLADPEVNQTLASLKLGAHVTRLIDGMQRVLDTFLVLRANTETRKAYNSCLTKFKISGKPACVKIVASLKALKGALRDRFPVQDLVSQFESLSCVRLEFRQHD